jgi:MFS transporter, UMF1 family
VLNLQKEVFMEKQPTSIKKSRFTKKEWAYIFYDWAESAYTVIFATFIFPLLYGYLSVDVGGLGQNVADSLFAFLVSGISLVVAILSPILGTLADYRGLKKKFFFIFFFVGLVSAISLIFYPVFETQSLWWIILIPYVIGTVGYTGTNVFYDSFIVDMTNDENMDRVSTTAYAFGYIGGSTIPLILAVVLLTILPDAIPGFTITLGFQITFLFTSLWWLIFSIPFLKEANQVYGIEREKSPVKKAFNRLFKTLKETRKYPKIFLFLLAFFLYIDGVHTIINLAARFAVNALDIPPEDELTTLLPIFLVIQIAAFIFALIFSRLSKIIKAERILLVNIATYAFISILGVFIRELWHFYILGILVATSQGSIQALSRSYFGKIIPKEKTNEFFGLYTVFSRFAAVIGPFIVGVVASLVTLQFGDLPGGNLRYGVLSLIILFITGGLIFNKARKLPDTHLDNRIEQNTFSETNLDSEIKISVNGEIILRVIRIFVWIGIIIGFPTIISPIVGFIALDKLKNAKTIHDFKIIGIMTLIFNSLIAGILILTIDSIKYSRKID